MNSSFRVTKNAFLCGLKLLGKRNRSFSYLSSANLAVTWRSSSEDETVVVEEPLERRILTLNSLRKCSHELPFVGEYVASHASTINYSKEDGGEMELVKSILTKHGWNVEHFDEYKANLSELKVIQALNYVFQESANAALALHFFRWLDCNSKHTIRSVCSMVCILICGDMNHRAIDLLMDLVREDCHEDAEYNLLFDILKEICSRGVLETVSSMLVKCYIEENKTGVALDLVCRMEHLNIFPLKEVCGMLLSSLLRSGHEEVAWDLMKKLQKRGMVNSLIFTLFINYYCKKGNVRCGWKLLTEMRNYGMKPDVVAYTIVVDFLCKRLYLREASSVLFKMSLMRICPDSVLLSSVIDGYCKAAMPEEAMRIVNFFSVSPNLFVYNSFLTKFCRDGDMVVAMNVFQEMLELGLRADCFSYTTMIDGYCKSRDAKNALKFLGKMLRNGIKLSVTTYTVLIDSYFESGDIKKVELLFRVMREEGMVPDIVVYNTMIDGYGKKGHLHKAFELLDRMQSVGISPDTVTYNSIIHSLVFRGFVKEAKHILDELIRRGFAADIISFTSLIGGFSNKCQFEEAFLVWSYMSENHMKPDVVTCSALLNGYCRARRMDEASSLFSKMLDAGLIADLILYNTMIHGFCSMGNIEDACHLIALMVGQSIIPNDVTYQALVLGYEKSKVQSPAKSAAFKLQQILLHHGLHIDSYQSAEARCP